MKTLRLTAMATILAAFPLVLALGFYANYLLILLALIMVAGCLLSDRRRLTPDTTGWAFLAIFVALGFTYAATARQANDLLMIFNLLPFALYPVFSGNLEQIKWKRPHILLGWLSFAGVLIGLLIALVDRYIFNEPRAGYLVSDPIRIAHTALVLASFAIVLSMSETGWRRLAFWAVPLMALMIVLLAGARTAMIAFVPTVTIAVLLAFPVRYGIRVVAISAVTVILALLALNAFGAIPARFADLPDIFVAMWENGDIADRAVAERIELYRTGLIAFSNSPWVGYGWANFSAAISPYVNSNFSNIVDLPHLHNDLLTFAVTSGIVGVAAYFCLLALPVVAACLAPRDALFAIRLRLGILLSVSYFFMGLADTMLIFELHMTLFVVWTATISAFVRAPLEAGDSPR